MRTPTDRLLPGQPGIPNLPGRLGRGPPAQMSALRAVRHEGYMDDLRQATCKGDTPQEGKSATLTAQPYASAEDDWNPPEALRFCDDLQGTLSQWRQ
jgi:hypothetical protein